MTSKIEAIFWSIALPGFAQLLNKKLVKGIVLIALEFLINVNSNFNSAIMASFLGEIDEAIHIINFQWLMFYPCVYMFAMWDAFKDAKGETSRYSFLPFVFGAYSVTVGLIYSPVFKIGGVLLGPIWLPILSLIPGLLIGILLSMILKRVKKMKEQKGNRYG
jgi:hypothetical protein